VGRLCGEDSLAGLFAGGLGRLEALAGLIQPGLELPVIQGDQDLPLGDPAAGADGDRDNLGGDLGFYPGFRPGPDRSGSLEPASDRFNLRAGGVGRRFFAVGYRLCFSRLDFPAVLASGQARQGHQNQKQNCHMGFNC
jgi:hypothetical protein